MHGKSRHKARAETLTDGPAGGLSFAVTATEIVTLAYAAVPIVSAAGWAPQIFRLARRPQLGAGMSIPTWLLWTCTGIVSLAYVAVVVQDALLTATFAVNALGSGIILGFAVAARIRQNPKT